MLLNNWLVPFSMSYDIEKRIVSFCVNLCCNYILNKKISFTKRLKSKTCDRNGLSTSAKWYGSCIVIVGSQIGTTCRFYHNFAAVMRR